EYRVHFLHAERRIGATATVKADGSERTVVLRPCGKALARFRNSKGETLPDQRATLEMVVTPGVHRFSSLTSRLGVLRADSDFVSNIDRTNYWGGPKSDDKGRITFPALIPGATYWLIGQENGEITVAKDFSVDP